MIDAYAVLGLDSKATDAEIHAAYKALSRKYHPDHGGNPDDMAALNEAYALIKTPELRKEYDGQTGFKVTFRWMEKVFGESSVAENFGKPPEDDRCGARGSDISVTEEIPMEVFVRGAPGYTVKYTKTTECLMCSGTGAKGMANCPRCGGTGKVTFRKKTKQCPKCMGAGQVSTGECEVCHGEKSFSRDAEFTFDYLPGTPSAVFPGKGNEGVGGGPNGDLRVEFEPVPDTERGVDAFIDSDGAPYLLVTGRVPPEDFVLGGVADFDIYGKLSVVRVPAGTLGFEYRETRDAEVNGIRVEYMVLPGEAGMTPETEAAYAALRNSRNKT